MRSYTPSHPGYMSGSSDYTRRYDSEQYVAVRPWLKQRSVKVEPEDKPDEKEQEVKKCSTN